MYIPGTVVETPTCCKDLILQSARVVLSCSSCNTWRECPRKYLLQNRLSIQPPRDRLSRARTIGTFLHSLLAQSYALPNEAAEQLVYDRAVKPLEKERNELAAGDKLGTFDEDATVIAESWDLARVMFDYYWKTYPLDRSKINVKFIETTIVAPSLTGYPVAIVDLVLLDENKKLAWVVDHKSLTKKPESQVAGLSWSAQSYLYPALVASALDAQGLGDYIVPGIIYNLLQKPTIKFCKKDKDFSAYCQRVAEEYGKKDYRVMISVPLPSQPWIDNLSGIQALFSQVTFVGRVALDMSTPESFAEILNMYRCDSSSCRSPYDETCCPYLPLCNTHPDAWSQLILGGGPFPQKFDRPAPTEPNDHTIILASTP